MSTSGGPKGSDRRTQIRLVFIAIGFWLFLALAVRPLDHFFEESFTRFWTSPDARKLPKSDVVIVKLTDASLTGRARTPLPRDVLTKVVEEVARTRPRAIVLDHVLERDRSMRDTQLYSALTNAGNAYLAQGFRTGPHGTLITDSLIDPFLRSAQGIAPVTFARDDFGITRFVTLKYSDGLGREFPTLPVLIAGYPTNRLNELPEKLPLRFRALPEVLFPSVNAEALSRWTNANAYSGLGSLVNTNTVVIIGPFYEAARDQFTAPGAIANLEGTVAGAHLLAYALDTLAQRPWPHRMPRAIEILLSVMFILIGYGGTARTNWLGNRWLGLALVAACFIASFAVARWGWVWPVALIISGWLFGLLLGKAIRGNLEQTASPSAWGRKREHSRRT
jgi:CHASE2 domain-containing sensor protein